MLATRAVTLLSGVAIATLLARSLGAEEYGEYVLALNLAQVLSLPLLLGVPTLLMREVATSRALEDWGHLRGIVRWSFSLVSCSLAVVLLAYLTYSVFCDQTNKTNSSPYSLAVPLVAILAFTQLLSAVLQGFELPFRGNLADGFVRPVVFLLLVSTISVCFKLTSFGAMALHLAAAFTALIYGAATAFRHCAISEASNPTYKSKVWFQSLLPLTLASSAATINQRLDVFMLGFFVQPDQVASYNLALQVAGLALIVQTVVNSMVAPKIARMLASGNTTELQSLITTSSRVSLVGAVVPTALLLVASDKILEILVGTGFQTAGTLSALAGIGYVFNAGAGPVAITLNMAGFQHLTARTIGLSALLNGLLNLMLIPLWGVYGAVGATISSNIVRQGIMYMMVHRKLNLSTGVLSK